MTTSVQFVTVTEEHQDQRLDNFLLRELKGVPKSHIYRIIRKGEVRINKKRCDANDRLQAGDIIRIPPIRLSAESNDAPKILSAPQQALLDRIVLFENNDFMVINKPEGLAVHGGSGVKIGLIEMLRLWKPSYQKCELAHRLDRDTSGCILIAKKLSSLRVLHELLRDSNITKIYTALVKGYWPAKLRYIDVSLQKQILQSGERMVKVDEEGKESATTFRILQRFEETTLVSAELHTGRTHQIRVHAQHAGHPIVGDDKYGDDEFNKLMRKKGIKRMCLHATTVEFKWPADGKHYKFEAPVPEEFTLNN